MSIYGELTTNANYNATNLIEVKPNTIYKWHRKNNYSGASTTARLVEYGVNTQAITYTENTINGIDEQTITFTTSANTKYIRLSMRYTDTEVYVAPNNYINTTLSFIYQGNGALNSHDTMEITNTECVFTKNNFRVDLGSLDYSYISTGYFVSSNLNPAIKVVSNDQIVNAVCPEYIAITRNEFSSTYPNKTMRVDNNQNTPKMYFVNQSYTDATTFKTAMSGIMLDYELATPQVIRIPKKHLGIVDLGTLNYGMSSAGRFYINATTRIDNVKIPTSQDEIANIYCKEYMVINGYQASNYSTNLAFGINSNGYLYIRDDSCSSIAELQAKLSGKYLFYETENEVSDIADTIGIEKGGTITSNSQVLPNVDFNIKCK